MKKGFTLIELLVVIAIIGILATVIVINITGAQKKARGTKALNDMNEALKVASACNVNEGTVLTYGAGTPICQGTADQTAVQANWPAAAASTGYNITTTVTGGIITVAAINAGSQNPDGYTFTCTVISCSKTP